MKRISFFYGALYQIWYTLYQIWYILKQKCLRFFKKYETVKHFETKCFMFLVNMRQSKLKNIIFWGWGYKVPRGGHPLRVADPRGYPHPPLHPRPRTALVVTRDTARPACPTCCKFPS